MKKTVIPVLLLLIIAACTQVPTPVNDTIGENNKEVIRKYADAIVRGDTAAIGSFLADNYRGYGPGLNDSSNWEQEVNDWKKNWREEFASIKYERVGINAFTVAENSNLDGDWVADWAVITVTYKNGNKPVTFWWHGVSRVKEGKIDLSRSFFNINDFYTQQGYTITPPQVTAQ